MECSSSATGAVAHVFVEDRDLDSVCSFIRASRHVKYTSVAASQQLLVLGTSNGMVLVFQRDVSLRQLSLIRAAAQNTQAACSITLLRVTSDEKRVAASRSDGGISLIDLSPRLKAQPSVTDLLAGRQRTKITDMIWNGSGNVLYIGDEEGIVHGFNSSVTAIFSSVVELLRVDSSVVQLDCMGETLLISTLTRCYLFNVSSKVKTTIGKQLRNGHYGACFLRLPDVDTPSIYCARRKGRLWEADFKGSVLNTHELQESSPLPPAAVFSYRSGQAREERKRNSRDGLASEEHQDVIMAGLKFGRLFSFGSKHLLARSDSHICIIDPIAAKLLLWTDSFKGVVDIFSVKEDIYIISSYGDQLHEVHFSTASGYIESSLPLFQSIGTTAQCSGSASSIVRAIACCHVCLSGSAVLKEMLSTGRLQPGLLHGLFKFLEQSMSDEPFWSVSTSLASKLHITFSEWLDGQGSSSLPLNGSSHLPMEQSTSSDFEFEDVSPSGRSLPTAVWDKADASLLTVSDCSDTAASPSDSQSEMCQESSFQDDVISCDRVSSSDSMVQNDNDRDAESVASFPGSELSFETSSDQHSAQDLVFSEKAEASPPTPSAIGGGVSSTFRRLFPTAAGSPIDTLLVTKDKFASVLGSLLPRPKALLRSGRGRSASSSADLEPQRSAAEVVSTAAGAIADSVAAPGGQQGGSPLQQLLLQTHCVHAAVRSACGLDTNGSSDGSSRRQELLKQLGLWSDCLIRVHDEATSASASAVAECKEASSITQATAHGESTASWRMQLINVLCPWPLVDEVRRELVSAAMLNIELGCPTTDGHESASVTNEHKCDLLPYPGHNSLSCSETGSACEGCQIGMSADASEPDRLTWAAAASCSVCTTRGSASPVTKTCRFMRRFFFLADIKRLAAWIARLHCGLEYWKCFLECLEEAQYHKDQGTTIFQVSAGEPLSADETLHKVLTLAKPHGTAASAINGITSDVAATQVFLSASRFIILHPEKVVAFCAELRQLVHPVHVRYMIEINRMEPRHFVVYMDRILQSHATSESRDAFVQEQCRLPALGVYWLHSLLSCDFRHHATPVLSRCCGMIRPMSLSVVWPHKNLLDDILTVCLQQNEENMSEPHEAATTVRYPQTRSIFGLLKKSGYWSGCLALWRSRQRQTDEVLKCLLQNGDLDWFERETELINLSSEEWIKVFQLRKNQEPKVHDVEQQQDPMVMLASVSSDGDQPVSDTGTAFVRSAPNGLSSRSCSDCAEPAATPQLTVCLYCGETITEARTIRWDDLLLLFVKRHGLNKMWPLVHDAELPRDIFTLSFYKSCLDMAQTELRQATSVEKIMEAMNSYLWSRRPNYSAPDMRYLVDRQQDLTSGNEQEAISAAAPRSASMIHKMRQVLLDDAACHWGALLDRASTKCHLCARHILTNPSSSGDGTVVVFDCAHVYHRHCLLDDRGCLLCISASLRASATEHSLAHSLTQR